MQKKEPKRSLKLNPLKEREVETSKELNSRSSDVIVNAKIEIHEYS